MTQIVVMCAIEPERGSTRQLFQTRPIVSTWDEGERIAAERNAEQIAASQAGVRWYPCPTG